MVKGKRRVAHIKSVSNPIDTHNSRTDVRGYAPTNPFCLLVAEE